MEGQINCVLCKFKSQNTGSLKQYLESKNKVFTIMSIVHGLTSALLYFLSSNQDAISADWSSETIYLLPDFHRMTLNKFQMETKYHSILASKLK